MNGVQMQAHGSDVFFIKIFLSRETQLEIRELAVAMRFGLQPFRSGNAADGAFSSHFFG